MTRRPPEVEGCDGQHKKTQAKHGNQGGDGSFLKFKDSGRVLASLGKGVGQENNTQIHQLFQSYSLE